MASCAFRGTEKEMEPFKDIRISEVEMTFRNQVKAPNKRKV
jgi:hypothetical protein